MTHLQEGKLRNFASIKTMEMQQKGLKVSKSDKERMRESRDKGNTRQKRYMGNRYLCLTSFIEVELS